MTPTDDVRARVEIAELLARFGNALDAGDFDALEALFSADAEFHIEPPPADVALPLRGARGIRDTIERRWAVVSHEEQRRHVIANVVVDDLVAGRARVRSVLTVLAVGRRPGSTVEVHGLGIYDDVVERQGDRWVIAERRLRVDRAEYFAPGWTSPD